MAIHHPSKLPVCEESQNRWEVGPALHPRYRSCKWGSYLPRLAGCLGVETKQAQGLPTPQISESRAHGPCRQSHSSKLMVAAESELSGGVTNILLVVLAPPGTSYCRNDWLCSGTQPPPALPGCRAWFCSLLLPFYGLPDSFPDNSFSAQVNYFVRLEFRILTGMKFYFALFLLSFSNYSTSAILKSLPPKS